MTKNGKKRNFVWWIKLLKILNKKWYYSDGKVRIKHIPPYISTDLYCTHAWIVCRIALKRTSSNTCKSRCSWYWTWSEDFWWKIWRPHIKMTFYCSSFVERHYCKNKLWKVFFKIRLMQLLSEALTLLRLWANQESWQDHLFKNPPYS